MQGGPSTAAKMIGGPVLPQQRHSAAFEVVSDSASGKTKARGITPSPVGPSGTSTSFPSTTDPSMGVLQYMFAKDDGGSKDTVIDKNTIDGYQTSRRSVRDKKSTIIHIDGHAVLRQNNYVLKGLSYEYGAYDADAPKKNSNKRKALDAAAADRKNEPKKAPRPISHAQKLRVQMNATIQNRIKQKEPHRSRFLAQNLPTLEPFLEKKVHAKLNMLPFRKHQISSSSFDEEELFVQPDAIQADMRDYQLQGLSFMASMHRRNLGMILGDEMGLGKTLQTISLLCHLKEQHGVTGPSLVVCPLSVLYSWCAEIKKWAPSLTFLRFHSSCEQEREAQRASFIENATSFDVVVTTYEMAKSPSLKSLWARQHFNYLILDEGHRIKDANNQISTAVRAIHRENSLILTGTPLQNNLVELWSLLYFLLPDVFTTHESFGEAFNITERIVDKQKLHQAHELLGLFMIRRLKDQVEKLMPKKIETKVLCPLSNTQIFWYKALLLKDINLLARSDEKDKKKQEADANSTQGAAGPKHSLNNLVMQLRKCCIHPFLFDGAEVDMQTTTCQDLIAASGKLAVLDKLLRSLYKKKHRVVLFSQFTSVLDIVQDYCTMRGWNNCRFDGSTARAKRNYIVEQFNAPESDNFIFLMSTRSGGMGLNLQTADTCILMDSDWNPQPDLQAMARVHRIGQKKTVHVYRLICAGTVEERMVERQEKKLFLDRMVNQDAALPSAQEDENSGVEKKDLLTTLRFGCDAVFGADSEKQNSLPTSVEIDMITDRSRSEEFSDGKIKQASNQAANFDANKQMTSTTKLGGIDFKAIREEHKKNKKKGVSAYGATNLGGIADQWKQLAKRQRKQRLVMIDSNGSGWGTKSVPVLAANNYDLQDGESSVFQRELGGRTGNYGEIKKRVQKSGVDFDEQDFCQNCGDGGVLMICPRCPVCVHKECAQVTKESDFMCCSHHRCTDCGKNTQSAGGILFPCQSCPRAYCEDCLPSKKEGMRLLGTCERFEKLGFNTTKHAAYIHCSTACENVAKKEFGWLSPEVIKIPCPPKWDVSYNFGSTIDETVEAPSEDITTRLRTRTGKKHDSVTAPKPLGAMNGVDALY